jgi:hypothetical protein
METVLTLDDLEPAGLGDDGIRAQLLLPASGACPFSREPLDFESWGFVRGF